MDGGGADAIAPAVGLLSAGAFVAVYPELEFHEGGDQGAVGALHDLGRSPSRHSQPADPRYDCFDPGWCTDRIRVLIALEPAGSLNPGLTFADQLDDALVEDVDRLADLGQVGVAACVHARERTNYLTLLARRPRGRGDRAIPLTAPAAPDR